MHPILGTEKKRGTETQDTSNLIPYFKIQLDFAFGGGGIPWPCPAPQPPHTHMHTHACIYTHVDTHSLKGISFELKTLREIPD